MQSSPNFFAYSRILRLYENGRLISYFACRGLDLSSDDAESLFALTKTAQKDILVKRARVAAGRPLVRCRKQLLSQADFAILDQVKMDFMRPIGQSPRMLLNESHSAMSPSSGTRAGKRPRMSW